MKLYLGTTQSWIVDNKNYAPSLGYSMMVYFVSSTNKYQLTATTEGDAHKFALTGSETWVPGEYTAMYYVTKGVNKVFFAQEEAIIYPNPEVAPFDARTHTKKVLDALKAYIEGVATSNDIDVIRTAIGNDDLMLEKDSSRLLEWYKFYQNLYNTEKQAEKIKNGLNTNNIYVRFVK